MNFVEKIYTKEGIVKENIFTSGESVLHIGSGDNKLPGTISVDILDLPAVDLVHDLDSFPWPYQDNEFDLVFAHNVFEHLEDQVATMEEVWRILKPGGRFVITVPYFRSVDAFTDSTHEHFFTSRSLDYFIDHQSMLAEYSYTKLKFKKIGFWFGWPIRSRNLLIRIFKKYIHRKPKFYDQYLSLLLPVDVVIWELEK